MFGLILRFGPKLFSSFEECELSGTAAVGEKKLLQLVTPEEGEQGVISGVVLTRKARLLRQVEK